METKKINVSYYTRVIRRYVDSNIGEALVDEHTAHYENPLKFSGKELDEITGLYDHGARNRNPISTLWYGIDPLFEKYPDFSPYNYCAGNPVKLVDPDGQEPRKVTITVSGKPIGIEYRARTYPEEQMSGGKYVLYRVPIYKVTITGKNNNGETVSQSWNALRFMPYLNQNPEESGYRTQTGETPIASGLADAKINYKIKLYDPNYKIHNTSSPENGGFVIEGSFMIHDGPDNLEEDAWGGAGCIEIMGERGFDLLKNYIHSLSGLNGKREKDLVDLVKSGNLILNLEKAERPKLPKEDF